MIAHDTELECNRGFRRRAPVPISRGQLSQAILDVLASWTDLDRSLFRRVHFGGESPEAAAHEEGITPGQARSILAFCERELVEQLRPLRAPRAAERAGSSPGAGWRH
jgi:DNA-directed RNA polymerase specialized sigma24 family protein